MASASTKPAPARIPETLEEKFERLAAEWQAAVAHLSSSSKREHHPAYKEIIALGPPVVPLLLRDLEINRRHWFAALSAITGANPVAEPDAGNILKTTESWLQWGKEQGYQW
ncbi:MAG: hypothetical protein L0Y71_23890 [Gemmataceae bacterium]|nr:hypothetical protein [Gemmataceae bacterium]